MLTFVVQHEGVNRLVRVKNRGDLLEAAKSAFSVCGTYCLEVFYSEFDVFIRVSDPAEDIPCGGRIRLVLDTDPLVLTPPVPKSVSAAETVPVLTLAPSGTDATVVWNTPSCSAESPDP